MLRTISWNQYLGFILFLVVVYYAFVLIRYFRKDLSKLLRDRKSHVLERSGGAPTETSQMQSSGLATDHNHFSQVYELLEELKPVFAEAESRIWIKEELLTAIKGKVQPYLFLNGTAFQHAVNNHIIQQAEAVLGMTLTEEDIRPVWA